MFDIQELNKDLFRPLTKEELAEQISQDAKSKEPQSNTKGIQQQAQGDDDIQNVNPSTLQLTNDSTDASSVWNMVKDLHLELLQMYHRVSLKLANMGTGKCDKLFWSHAGCFYGIIRFISFKQKMAPL